MGNSASTPAKRIDTSTVSCYNFQSTNVSERYQYIMQMNEERVDRFQIQHHLYREVLKNNFSAPIDDVLKQGASVLDLGCGPGMWVCEMATNYRLSLFHGIDYHNIFPTQKPVNAQFIKANLLEGLPFKDASFDYVHLRSMVFCFTPDQWEHIVINEAIRLLRPNAYIELSEFDVKILNGGPCVTRFSDALREKLFANKMDPSIALKLSDILQQYKSLKNVRRQEIRVNFGRSGGKLGEIQAELSIRLLREDAKLFRGLFKMNAREYDEFVENYIQELNTHPVYMTWYKFWAQKKN
ncbi:9232_t:CDS:2 [Ambispora leptoticha]|uniref:9232_t:CDS:1 n=1 Tax=Ambispora leptoticha TaxID=144679 RepID=A0A9N9GB22_9GLOM|nr:9232_t:CDS:2 [Ambispora leptoticha]